MRLLPLLSLVLALPATAVTLHLIGDSTMADKDLRGGNPERGWGHMLSGFLPDTVTVRNMAANGRSTKSFLAEGRWDATKEGIHEGDYVFIQFGHNDASDKGERSTTPGGDFDDNLRRYVSETRELGATPVLFTPITRRKWQHDTLVDTHGPYTEAIRCVAAETNTPLVDMNASSIALVKELGDEGSKALYMHIPEGTIAKYPEGLKDNTHFNVHGGRVMASLAIDGISEAVPVLAPLFTKYDYVVAQDGSGDFFTLQEAIAAVPDYRDQGRTTILIRPGEYREKLVIPASKTNLSLIGQTGAVIAYDDNAHTLNAFGEELGTIGSAAVMIYPDDFYAEGITFQNLSGLTAGQAVAVLVAGDRSSFRDCRFLGFQDTLYTYGTGRQYYEDCHIEGSVDFIFGSATALFNRCTIHCVRKGGYLTAPSTPEGARYGYVFFDCKLTASEDVDKVWLSRPWRQWAKAVYVGCQMGAHIRPEGWHNWGKPEKEKTTFYAEAQCTGPGADTSQRAQFGRRNINVADYQPALVVAGTDGWNPIDAAPVAGKVEYK